MHSFLICHGTKSARLEKLNRLVSSLGKKVRTDQPLVPDPDTIIVKPTPSIGIDAIRSVAAALKLKPFSSSLKIVVFLSAERITLQAQHALLKTLEEPTKKSVLILETKNPYSLLPTIRSRCQLLIARSKKSPPKKPSQSNAAAHQ